MPLPLHGVRVLDVTNVLAGPFCSYQLVLLGAEVIKIEQPERGDLARQLGADTKADEQLMGVSFVSVNAGKQSVTLNLKSPEGKEIFKRLAAISHAVIENFRPGVMARLGLDYPVLAKVNPRLVYCAISGFGQEAHHHHCIAENARSALSCVARPGDLRHRMAALGYRGKQIKVHGRLQRKGTLISLNGI